MRCGRCTSPRGRSMVCAGCPPWAGAGLDVSEAIYFFLFALSIFEGVIFFAGTFPFSFCMALESGFVPLSAGFFLIRITINASNSSIFPSHTPCLMFFYDGLSSPPLPLLMHSSDYDSPGPPLRWRPSDPCQ
ncbi:hypothetical protein B0H12DRAFT_755514 [Mycena haematopus]|nr:hypothetical protein B0H12DRAFT_755514 [Mycena haematopus]